MALVVDPQVPWVDEVIPFSSPTQLISVHVFCATVDAEKRYMYPKIGGGIHFQKYYIFFADLSLIRINL